MASILDRILRRAGLGGPEPAPAAPAPASPAVPAPAGAALTEPELASLNEIAHPSKAPGESIYGATKVFPDYQADPGETYFGRVRWTCRTR